MENDFDKQLRDALHDYEAGYDAADWEDLEARLEEEPDRSSPPFWLKGLEAFVLLLLVITIYNFWGPKGASAEKAQRSTTVEATSATTGPETTAPTTEMANKASSETASLLPTEAQATSNASAPETEPKKPAAASDYPATSPKTSVETTKTLKAEKTKASETTSATSPAEEKLDQPSKTSDAAPSTEPFAELPPVEEAQRDWLSARLVLPLYPERLEGSLVKERPRRTKLRKPFQTEWRYGLLFSTDANSNSPYGRGRMGESFGFNLHALLSERLAVESGMGISFKRFDYNGPLRQYDDDGVLRINENVTEQRNTQIATLYIPLSLQYEVYENKKWRGYLTAGGSFQAVLWQRHSGTFRQTQGQQQGGQVQTTAQINTIGAERGLWQNGTLEQNYFLSWSLGLGLERQVSDQWHLFVQPNYQQAFTDYGQRNSRFAAFSLNMGLRTTFNKLR